MATKRERDEIDNASSELKKPKLEVLSLKEKLEQRKKALLTKIAPKTEPVEKPSESAKEIAEKNANIEERIMKAKKLAEKINREKELEKATEISLSAIYPAPVRTFSLSYNQRVQKKAIENKQKQEIKKELRFSSSFDPRLKGRLTRKDRSLNFFETGQFVHKLEKEESKLTKEKKENESESDEEEETEENEKETTIALGSRSLQNKFDSGVPDVEWWDVPFLVHRDYTSVYDESNKKPIETDSMMMPEIVYFHIYPPTKPLRIPDQTLNLNNANIRYDRLTNLIEHPPIREMSQVKIAPLPPMNTKDERKKIRRRRREEERKEQQDRVLMGLEPPVPSKVKLSNLMMVLTNEAVKDPTAVAKKVREEVEKRKANHERRNQDRKLTREERKKKKMQKLVEDAKYGVYANVFALKQIEGSNVFAKLGRSARSLQLTGCVAMAPKQCVIVVEGGVKAIKKYKKLVMKRIKWTQLVPGKDFSDNYCKLVWEGPILQNSFKGFLIQTYKSDNAARKYMAQSHAENYWDMTKLSNQKEKFMDPLNVALSLLHDSESDEDLETSSEEEEIKEEMKIEQ